VCMYSFCLCLCLPCLYLTIWRNSSNPSWEFQVSVVCNPALRRFLDECQRSAPLHSSLVCCSETTAPWTPGTHWPQILSTWHRLPPHHRGPRYIHVIHAIHLSIHLIHFIHSFTDDWLIGWMDGCGWTDEWMKYPSSIEEKNKQLKPY
jgi:hypothetical protein